MDDTKMSNIKSWLFLIGGVLVIVLSIFFGLYVGLWLCLVGGVVDIIEGFQTDPMQAVRMGVGVVKILSASIAVWISFAFGLVFGKLMLDQA